MVIEDQAEITVLAELVDANQSSDFTVADLLTQGVEALWLLTVLGLLTYAVAALAAGWWPFPQLNVSASNANAVIYSFCGGSLGASVYAAYRFYESVTVTHYDRRYLWWHIFHPILGGFIGALVWATLHSGVAVLGATAPATGPADLTRSDSAYFALAFIAGFSLKGLFGWITATADRAFPRN